MTVGDRYSVDPMGATIPRVVRQLVPSSTRPDCAVLGRLHLISHPFEVSVCHNQRLGQVSQSCYDVLVPSREQAKIGYFLILRGTATLYVSFYSVRP